MTGFDSSNENNNLQIVDESTKISQLTSLRFALEKLQKVTAGNHSFQSINGRVYKPQRWSPSIETVAHWVHVLKNLHHAMKIASSGCDPQILRSPAPFPEAGKLPVSCM